MNHTAETNSHEPKPSVAGLIRVLRRLSDSHVDPAVSSAAVHRVRQRIVRAESAAVTTETAFLSSRRRFLLTAVVAASAILAVIVPWRPFGRSNAATLAWEQIESAKTMSLTWTPIWSKPGLETPSQKLYVLEDDRIRSELSDGQVMIFDYRQEKNRRLMLDNDGGAWRHEGHDSKPENIHSMLTELQREQVQFVGEAKFGSRKALRFLVEFQPAQRGVREDWLIFADLETSLPFRIETTIRNVETGEPITIGVAKDIEFGKPLDEAIFSTEPPPGYQLRN